MPGIRAIEQGKSIAMPTGALGIAEKGPSAELRFGLTAQMDSVPELPEYQGLQNGDSTISKLMKNFIDKQKGDNEFKAINRKNDLMLQRLIEDKPEERYRTKPHVYVNPRDDIKFDDTFMNTDNGTFNDRTLVGLKLPSDSKVQNYDVVNKWESTLSQLKDGIGYKDGIRETQYPLKPFPFDELH